MSKVRCADCGMIASVPEINKKEEWLADPGICSGSGPIYSCGRCGSKNLIGISQPTKKEEKVEVETLTPVLPSGFARCPRCSMVFEIKPDRPTPQPLPPIITSTITCRYCHMSTLRPRIPKEWLDQICGKMRINCEVCHRVIFEGTPQEALEKGLAELAP